jgi:hypothetical protein
VQSGLTHKIYNCDPHRIPAKVAEELVWRDVESVLSGDLAEELLSKVKIINGNNQQGQDIERLKNKIYSINSQIESLTVRLGELPKEVSATAIYTQMGKLEVSKKEHDEKILELKSERLQNQLPADLLTYENFIEILNKLKGSTLTTSKKQKIIVSLIERIKVFPKRLDIHFAVGSEKIKRELVWASSLDESSTSLTDGRRNRDRTYDHLDVDQALYH